MKIPKSEQVFEIHHGYNTFSGKCHKSRAIGRRVILDFKVLGDFLVGHIVTLTSEREGKLFGFVRSSRRHSDGSEISIELMERWNSFA